MRRLESHPRQWVDCFKFFLDGGLPEAIGIPPTAVGGLVQILLRQLKYPPTAVGGISCFCAKSESDALI
jgi:hypothetical protein